MMQFLPFDGLLLVGELALATPVRALGRRILQIALAFHDTKRKP